MQHPSDAASPRRFGPPTQKSVSPVGARRAPRHFATPVPQPTQAASHFKAVLPKSAQKGVCWSSFQVQHAPHAPQVRLSTHRSLPRQPLAAFPITEFLPPASIGRHAAPANTDNTGTPEDHAIIKSYGPLDRPLDERVGFLAPRRLVAAATVAALLAVGGGQVATSNIAANVAASSDANTLRAESQDATRGVPRTDEAAKTQASVIEATTTVVPTTQAPPPTTAAPAPTTTAAPPTTKAPTPKKAAEPAKPPTVPSNYAGCSKSKAAARDCWMGLIAQYNWDDERAFSVMWCESTGNPNARNRYSTATGLFQILDGPTDPVANVRLAHQMWSKRGWQPWVCKG